MFSNVEDDYRKEPLSLKDAQLFAKKIHQELRCENENVNVIDQVVISQCIQNRTIFSDYDAINVK